MRTIPIKVTDLLFQVSRGQHGSDMHATLAEWVGEVLQEDLDGFTADLRKEWEEDNVGTTLKEYISMEMDEVKGWLKQYFTKKKATGSWKVKT